MMAEKSFMPFYSYLSSKPCTVYFSTYSHFFFYWNIFYQSNTNFIKKKNQTPITQTVILKYLKKPHNTTHGCTKRLNHKVFFNIALSFSFSLYFLVSTPNYYWQLTQYVGVERELPILFQDTPVTTVTK